MRAARRRLPVKAQRAEKLPRLPRKVAKRPFERTPRKKARAKSRKRQRSLKNLQRYRKRRPGKKRWPLRRKLRQKLLPTRTQGMWGKEKRQSQSKSGTGVQPPNGAHERHESSSNQRAGPRTGGQGQSDH